MVCTALRREASDSQCIFLSRFHPPALRKGKGCAAAMSGGFRVLHVVRPFLFLLPEVQQAGQGRKVPFREKALYTTVALAIFLVCSQCVPVRPLARRARAAGAAWSP